MIYQIFQGPVRYIYGRGTYPIFFNTTATVVFAFPYNRFVYFNNVPHSSIQLLYAYQFCCTNISAKLVPLNCGTSLTSAKVAASVTGSLIIQFATRSIICLNLNFDREKKVPVRADFFFQHEGHRKIISSR
ncbi:unnamed protein product [Schistosoma rodhaini]|nr:unnamed protein product [Schistosoma rodhaini]